jgi:hypothetical protein
MAIQTHNVTADDVVEDLPFATGTVTATSKGLNTPMVERWVKAAAGQLNAILIRKGFDVDNLGENESELVRMGISAFARGRALKKREYDGAGDELAIFNDVKDTIRRMDQDMGETAPTANSIHSNIPDAHERDRADFDHATGGKFHDW